MDKFHKILIFILLILYIAMFFQVIEYQNNITNAYERGIADGYDQGYKAGIEYQKNAELVVKIRAQNEINTLSSHYNIIAIQEYPYTGNYSIAVPVFIYNVTTGEHKCIMIYANKTG